MGADNGPITAVSHRLGEFDDIRDFPGFRQVSRDDEKHQLQVFCPSPPSSSIQAKFESLLLSLENPQWMDMGSCLIQFWAPIRSRSKRKRLSISKQPFGVGKVCDGVCRYRHLCTQYANGMKDISKADPVCRSFTRGSPEFCPNIDSYSTQEFPLKSYARNCGFQGYLALPVFEHPNDRKRQPNVSAGVLEILTFAANISLGATFLEKIKAAGLAIRCPPPYGKPEVCTALDPLRNLYNLPLTQVWFPCICNGAEVSLAGDHGIPRPMITHLFRGLEQIDSPFQKWQDGNAYFVEDGKSWVGKAHSLSKICFVEDISRFNIMDYPLVPLARLSGLTACCAIPFRTIHQNLPPLVLEVFLPQHNDVENRRDFLQSLLCTWVKKLLKHNVEFGLAEGEELSVHFSHREEFSVYYDVRRVGGKTGCKALGNVKEDKNGQLGEDSKATENFHNHELSGSHSSHQEPDLETTDDIIETSTKRGKRKINFAMLQKSFGRSLDDVAAEFKVHRSTLKRYCRSYGIERWPSHNKRRKENSSPNEQKCDSRPSLNRDSKEKQVTGANGPGNYNFDHNHSLIVKARYNESLVKFPFSTNSGIEALFRSLAMRFKLEVERIRIEYEDEDGDKVMISCDEDLSYHMHTLSSSGRTRMDLSVLPSA